MKILTKALFASLLSSIILCNLCFADYTVLLNNGQRMDSSYLKINKKEISLLIENGLIKIPLYSIGAIETSPSESATEIINSFWYYKTGDPSLQNSNSKNINTPEETLSAHDYLAFCQNMAARLMFEQYAQHCNDIFYEYSDIHAQKALYLYKSNKIAEALALINALNEQERNDEVLHIKGLILLELDKYKDANLAWSKAYILKPKETYRYMAKQAYWLHRNATRFAREELQKVRILYPKNLNNTASFKKLKTTIIRFQEELGLVFAFQPYKKILVVIYPNDQFNKLTGAPSWTKGFTQNLIYLSEQDDFSYVIKHELTHAFINQLSFDRAPLWFQEGLAQYLSHDRADAMQHKHFKGYPVVKNNDGMAANDDTNQPTLYQSSLDQITALLKKHDELAIRHYLTLLRKGEQEKEAVRKAFGN